MTDPIVIAITMIMVGQICLSVPLLLTRGIKSALFLPLALFLLANGAIALEPMVSTLLPEWYALYTALAFPALFTLCPALWFYVEALTSPTPWKIHKKQVHHFVLLWPALMVSVMILFLPKETHIAIFINEADAVGPLALTLVVSILVLMLLWLGHCVYTISHIIHRLVAYRKQLKDLFSNNDDKELHWMNWLLLIAISTWLFSLATVFSSNLFDNLLFSLRTEAILSLLLIWSLAHFGLQQKPGLTEPVYNFKIANSKITSTEVDKSESTNAEVEVEVEVDQESSTAKKYQRSALGSEQSDRIAVKINTVMATDKLYLDANLSLQKLASYLAISPNYISQTLNETLAINFFDFVNQWRIEAAKPKIIANQDTVLNIALEVGFNARSSFYKAFKQETGQTPSEFRKMSK
ncbi:helix-turn-helix domain-containing protein [Colwellia psychrerythraea]|uniref:Transcriptional regulator with only HTH domain, AraC family n=1 Tax=Colwellia psychrerythraea TaxID=28229 RepID=A0A099K7T0_COLPS|nr:AraC family transcriptional regulator [Colwellia psychrerythraea]KGJ86839.1 transcriptional regulator with only HTH domain, AraC family [Colwellia psychrerythraea]